MNMPVLALLAVLLIAVWVLVRSRRGAKDEQPAPRSSSSALDSAYHAVSIKMSGNACEAARAMGGRRFLSSAAPKLPLPDCNVLDCSCRFVHHKDRRAGKDRRSPFSPAGFGGGTGAHEVEHREGSDRRKSDDDYR